jgi:hypothetical protein
MPSSLKRLAFLVASGLFLLTGWTGWSLLNGAEHTSSPRIALADDGTRVIPPNVLPSLIDAASPVEATALADGKVTRAEYVGVVDATLSCLRDNGFRVIHVSDQRRGVFFNFSRLASAQEGPHTNDRGIIEYGATGGRAASVDENGRLVENCKHTSELIERLWAEHAPPGAAYDRPAHVADLAQCLREAGVTVPQGVSEAELKSIAFPIDPALGIGVPSKEYKACETARAIPW